MEIPENVPTEGRLCVRCNNPVAEEAMYCNNCGGLLTDVYNSDDPKDHQRLISIAIFFGVHLVACLVFNFAKFTKGLTSLLIFDGLLSLLTVVYAILFWKEIRYLFTWVYFSFIKIILYASTSIACAIVVNFVVKWLNRTIFDEEIFYYSAFSHLRYAKLATIMSVALQPAIFEELAFRGVMQEGLNKITDKKQALFITAFLFSLLHMSFVSFIWMIPFALWLGYVRNKEETIWYGVIIHFCFNTTACFLEFFELNLW